jgi:hypothetical protein
MFVHPETGDILGWDARMKPENEGYRLTLFCGEGSLQGPVHGTVRFVRNEASVVPDSEACGTPIRLRKLPNGLKIEVESGEWETVPKHKNFIADRMWK